MRHDKRSGHRVVVATGVLLAGLLAGSGCAVEPDLVVEVQGSQWYRDAVKEMGSPQVFVTDFVGLHVDQRAIVVGVLKSVDYNGDVWVSPFQVLKSHWPVRANEGIGLVSTDSRGKDEFQVGSVWAFLIGRNSSGTWHIHDQHLVRDCRRGPRLLSDDQAGLPAKVVAYAAADGRVSAELGSGVRIEGQMDCQGDQDSRGCTVVTGTGTIRGEKGTARVEFRARRLNESHPYRVRFLRVSHGPWSVTLIDYKGDDFDQDLTSDLPPTEAELTADTAAKVPAKALACAAANERVSAELGAPLRLEGEMTMTEEKDGEGRRCVAGTGTIRGEKATGQLEFRARAPKGKGPFRIHLLWVTHGTWSVTLVKPASGFSH